MKSGIKKSSNQPSSSITLPAEVAYRVIIWGVALTTLFLYTTVIDPFNAPKSWVIYLTASWLVGFLIFDLWGAVLGKDEKLTLVFVGLFILAMVIDLFATNYLYTGLVGDYGRRTGFLAYLSLAVISLAAMRLIKISNLARLELMFLIVTSLVAFYGICQHYGIDFVKWNNPFNPVISTLGNPDFASAALGIMAVLCFGIAANRAREIFIRTWGGFAWVIANVTIVFSHSLQGLLISIIGTGFLIIVLSFQKYKSLGWSEVGIGLIIGVVSIFGMLNIGPLKAHLYKASVTYRGDYWRAGMRMFIHNPIFGVGLDRYGEYFRQYRDPVQVLRRGPDLVSNAAHNVFIQFAATGGILLVGSYILLVVYIIYRGWVALKNTTGAQQIAVATVCAGWLAYLAQSFISIDNLGVVIWGWLLSGAVLGLSHSVTKTDDQPKRKKYFKGELSTLVSGLAFIAAMVPVIIFFLSDKSILVASSVQLPQNAQQQQIYKSYVEKPLGYPIVDPSTALLIAGKLAEGKLYGDSAEILNKYLTQDKNNYQFTDTLAELDEQTNNVNAALPYRKVTVEIDPYNPNNWEHYGLDLLNNHDTAGAKLALAKINAFDKGSSQAQTLSAAIAKG